MDKKKLKRSMGEISRDIMVAFVIVAVIMLSLYAYCGIWPPMVVVESGSMEHPPSIYEQRSYIGVIDTGDMVFVKEVDASPDQDLLTYTQGEAGGHSTYGSFGDVVIYRPNGLENRIDGTPVIPIIHRLVVWLELNTTHVDPNFDGVDYANYSFDVPSLNIYDSTEIIRINNYGYRQDTVIINLGLDTGLLQYYEIRDIVPHGGYITKGDNNEAHDQQWGGYEPVLPEWVIGKAWGEIPWFGLIKLWASGVNTNGVPPNSWTGLLGTICLLLLIPFVLDYVYPKVKKAMGKGKDVESEEEKLGLDEQTPEEIDPGKKELPLDDKPKEELPPGNTQVEEPPDENVPSVEEDSPPANDRQDMETLDSVDKKEILENEATSESNKLENID